MHLQVWGFESQTPGFRSYVAFESFALERFRSLVWGIQILMPCHGPIASSSIMNLNSYFEDLDLLSCFSFSQMRDLNLVVGDSNPFLFSTLCFKFFLEDSDHFVENSDPLAFSPKSLLILLRDLDPLSWRFKSFYLSWLSGIEIQILFLRIWILFRSYILLMRIRILDSRILILPLDIAF